jgi:3-oxo-5alpha-steroid 4-dehydrogenase
MNPSQSRSPLRVSEAKQLTWDAQVDLLVVGYGAAGASAAIDAARQDLSIMVLERFAGGGASALSGGVVYAGGGTAYQQQAGYQDTPEAMFNYLRNEVGEAVSEATLRDFCERSREQLGWLERLGAEFEASVPPLKTSYPSDKYYLYYSGNEPVPAYASQAKPAPRGHRVKGFGLSGAALFATLNQDALAAGVQVRVEAWQLASGSRAAVKHARWSRWAQSLHMYAPALAERLRERARKLEQRHAQRCLIQARGGVLLSAGGFILNRPMVAQHAPAYMAGLPLGAAGCDGSGIALGQSVGGTTARMEKVSAWRFINPPLAWARGMLVNARGLRYCNEEVYGATLGHAMVEANDGRAVLVINRTLLREALRQVGPGKVWQFQRLPVLLNLLFGTRKAKSITQLASRCGLPPQALAQTLEAYNQAARGEQPDSLGKSQPMLADMSQGPWYALDLSFDSRLFPCPTITLGGLRVCEQSGQVLNHGDQPIAGLYSAGRNAVGVASNLYVSGLSLADCIYSGRRAAAHVAAQASSGSPALQGKQT